MLTYLFAAALLVIFVSIIAHRKVSNHLAAAFLKGLMILGIIFAILLAFIFIRGEMFHSSPSEFECESVGGICADSPEDCPVDGQTWFAQDLSASETSLTCATEQYCCVLLGK